MSLVRRNIPMGSNWSDRRVVITGLGVASSLGNDANTLWDSVIAGHCGIGRVSAFDIAAFDCQIAAEVRNFDPTPAFPNSKEVRRTDRFTHFGVWAGWQALKIKGKRGSYFNEYYYSLLQHYEYHHTLSPTDNFL